MLISVIFWHSNALFWGILLCLFQHPRQTNQDSLPFFSFLNIINKILAPFILKLLFLMVIQTKKGLILVMVGGRWVSPEIVKYKIYCLEIGSVLKENLKLTCFKAFCDAEFLHWVRKSARFLIQFMPHFFTASGTRISAPYVRASTFVGSGRAKIPLPAALPVAACTISAIPGKLVRNFNFTGTERMFFAKMVNTGPIFIQKFLFISFLLNLAFYFLFLF